MHFVRPVGPANHRWVTILASENRGFCQVRTARRRLPHDPEIDSTANSTTDLNSCPDSKDFRQGRGALPLVPKTGKRTFPVKIVPKGKNQHQNNLLHLEIAANPNPQAHERLICKNQSHQNVPIFGFKPLSNSFQRPSHH